ncbi:unnamed protein product [Nesidiocoris tenuis]|uniref:Uncharacterized protein n=1 Tax=Nesidiocoris tenuis TaxID=355587 RepID=A0A6H5H8X0_9HEMI|nr:unnamed protein product [Nesidiocoris tenuis]
MFLRRGSDGGFQRSKSVKQKRVSEVPHEFTENDLEGNSPATTRTSQNKAMINIPWQRHHDQSNRRRIRRWSAARKPSLAILATSENTESQVLMIPVQIGRTVNLQENAQHWTRKS